MTACQTDCLTQYGYWEVKLPDGRTSLLNYTLLFRNHFFFLFTITETHAGNENIGREISERQEERLPN